VLAVGDGLPTDIAGAAAAGIDAVLITGGLHAQALGIGASDTPDAQRLAAFCEQYNCFPQAVLPALRW
jgi:ribonucleotide monophosphatase NagD (HAD superfamily)